jgi:tRNA threonylcarbamoyladenosine biosynthesis protein TsaB
MNLLAFDTSTETMHIAVSSTVEGRTQLWQHSGAGGAQASSTLIASILDLLQRAQLPLTALDAICFGSGPGSFTGLQGLAFGANVPVLGVESLLAVAEEARFSALATQPSGAVTALLDARMDEMYAATYAFDGAQWTTLHGAALVRPEDLVAVPHLLALAGNVFGVYAARLNGVVNPLQRITALPTATAMLRLAPQLLTQGRATSAQQALPTYIRDKVAKTTLERAAEKAAAGATTIANDPHA